MLVPGIRHSGHRRAPEALMSRAPGPAPGKPRKHPRSISVPTTTLAALLSYEKQRLLEVVPEVKALAARLASAHHHGQKSPGKTFPRQQSGAELQTVSVWYHC